MTTSAQLPPFCVLLDKCERPLYRFLVSAVGHDAAADCFQETVLAALRAYPGLRDARNLRGWLFTIAHRKTIDAHRDRARRPTPVAEVPETASPTTPDRDWCLWQAVRRLPSKQRTTVIHRFVGGLPYAEIGRIVGCSEGAARQRSHEALNRLREELT